MMHGVRRASPLPHQRSGVNGRKRRTANCFTLCFCCSSLNILSPFMQQKKHPACLTLPLFHQCFIYAASRCSHLRRAPPAVAWASCSGGTRGKLNRPDQRSPQTPGFTFSSCVLACWQRLLLSLFIMTRPAMWPYTDPITAAYQRTDAVVDYMWLQVILYIAINPLGHLVAALLRFSAFQCVNTFNESCYSE